MPSGILVSWFWLRSTSARWISDSRLPGMLVRVRWVFRRCSVRKSVRAGSGRIWTQ